MAAVVDERHCMRTVETSHWTLLTVVTLVTVVVTLVTAETVVTLVTIATLVIIATLVTGCDASNICDNSGNLDSKLAFTNVIKTHKNKRFTQEMHNS